jgi:prepilin-type N-terminal cleavage/methylation domain-containing protein/prepilin-type processing-associated H-X9-DG protein
MNRRAFSLIELLVVIGIIGVLLAILLPTLERAREHANTAACAANLSQIGQALTIYANENHRDFPRTTYVPGAPLRAGTGSTAADPFQAGGPAANDTSAPLFLLMRTQKLPAKIFADPYTDAIAYEADIADPATHSNFTDYKKNLAYSVANPYPDPAVAKDYKLQMPMPATFAVAADMNPGTDNSDSPNHELDGQNVLYGDGHVEFQKEPNCGTNHDDIYHNTVGTANASPLSPTDSVLLPTR